MTRRLQRLMAYLRDRLVNAYWMLRQGQFRQFCRGLLLELRTRKGQLESALVAQPTPVQRSGGRNPCAPVSASPRPSVLVPVALPSSPERSLDAVSQTLRQLLAAQAEPQAHNRDPGP